MFIGRLYYCLEKNQLDEVRYIICKKKKYILETNGCLLVDITTI